MYVHSITYEPFHGGPYDGVPMIHLRLVAESSLYAEPVDLYNEVLKASKAVGNQNNIICVEIDSEVDYVPEIVDFFGTLQDNGVFIIAITGGYSRPSWIGMVGYLVAMCGDERPLPFKANEVRYVPGPRGPIDGVYGHQGAQHILDLRNKVETKVVFDFLRRNPTYKVHVPPVRLYQFAYLTEDKKDEVSEVQHNSSRVSFVNNELNEVFPDRRADEGKG